jgi:fructose-1,6-bisphosphatase/inositol monophosphatase family enzyme
VVFDPARNELFTASRGRGAMLNDRRIRASKRSKLSECLIGTGFPFRDFSFAEAYINMFRDMMRATSGLRRPGSAALDLAYVACGRYDGFWEMHLQPWDLAAGSSSRRNPARWSATFWAMRASWNPATSSPPARRFSGRCCRSSRRTCRPN